MPTEEDKKDGRKVEAANKKPASDAKAKANGPVKLATDKAADAPKRPALAGAAAGVATSAGKLFGGFRAKSKVGAGVDSEASDALAVDPAERRRKLKSTAIRVSAAVVGLLAIVVIVFGVLIYGYRSESPAVKVVSSIIPYPVERVNGAFVSYHDYLFQVEFERRAYQNNLKLNNQPAVDFNSEDGKKLMKQLREHSLENLKSQALVAQLASQKKVKVTDKEVNDVINQLYERYGGKDTLLKTVNQVYGWNQDEFKGVIRQQILQRNLEEKVTSDPAVDSAAKAKSQEVLKQVKDGGDFTEIAKKSSQASDAASGGDLGFFTKGQLPDNMQSAAEALQPNQVSDVIKTQYGYEIIKVLEKKDDGSIHAAHILTKTIDFNEYFEGELKKAKVNVYVKAN